MHSMQNRNSGIWFFFSMLFVSALLGGLIVLAGVKYTNLGAALVRQDQTPQQNTGTKANYTAPSVTPSAQVQPAKALESATINVVKNVGPTVVMITTKQQQTRLDFWGPVTQEAIGQGSGVIFDKRGYILTNNHVISGQGKVKITVYLIDGRSMEGTVIGADSTTDLAVVKISNNNLPVAPLGESNNIQVGQFAMAIGNPLDASLRNTVTTGVISAIDRVLRVDQNTVMYGMLQTDAAINEGNSGGPLLNSDGQVIGINTAIVAQAQGIGFAIPISTAKQVAKQLIENGKVERPGLGCEGVLLDDSGLASLERQSGVSIPAKTGLFVRVVNPGSGAAKAGIQANRDLLTQIDGQDITAGLNLNGYLASVGTGGTVSLNLYRFEKTVLGVWTWRKHGVKVNVSIVR